MEDNRASIWDRNLYVKARWNMYFGVSILIRDNNIFFVNANGAKRIWKMALSAKLTNVILFYVLN